MKNQPVLRLKKFTVYTKNKMKFWYLRAYTPEDAAKRAGFKRTDMGRKVIVEAGI